MEKLCLQHIEMWNLLVMATTLCKCNNCQYDHPASNVKKACMSEWEQVASSFARIQIMNIMKRKPWHPCNHSWKGSDIRVQTYVPNSLHHAHRITNQMACLQKPSTIPEFFYLTAAEKIAMFSWDRCVCQIPFSYSNLRYTDASASGWTSLCTIHDKMLLPLHVLSCSGCLWFKLWEDS
jgi:hypothetical protein